jgi:predicted O-methyltransferase YrrM
MRIDPFFIKRLPKYHVKRLIYTLWVRLAERYSRFFFDEYLFPEQTLPYLPEAPQANWTETQVSAEHARYLLWAMRETDHLSGCVVEVGSWRGVTTAYLAAATEDRVVAIDPWIGDRNEENYEQFLACTSGFPNIRCERKAFGQAAREWVHGPVRFVFVDAAHDYANVAHDIAVARSLTLQGGIIAIHDTDNIDFAGCRRAIYEVLEHYELAAHIKNVVLLRVR